MPLYRAHFSILNKMLRVCLFWLKRVSGNHFTLLCLFGKHGKFGQMEINFRVDCKITLTACKTILGFILPENHLHFSHTLSSFSHEHSKLNEDRAPQSKTCQRKSPSDNLVRAPHTSPCSSADPQSTDPPRVRSTLYFTLTTSPDLQSTLYSV